MISVPFDIIIILFVSVPLTTIGIGALLYSFRSMHRPIQRTESIYKCTDCLHVYVFSRNRPMDRCPRCGQLNDALRT